jgi:multimeric flavodoxin WrbA
MQVCLFGHLKKKMAKVFGEKLGIQYQKTLMNSDGFILVVPEYGGMATPAAKIFFCYVEMES